MRTCIALSMLSAFFVPGVAIAGSLHITPATITLSEGQITTFMVSVLPANVPIYTASAMLAFNPALVSVVGVTHQSGSMPLIQGDYDYVDSAGGFIRKTAGFPGGITSATPFIVIRLQARAQGQTTLSVDEGSLLLDADGNNILAGGADGVITVVSLPESQPTGSAQTINSPDMPAVTAAPAVAGEGIVLAEQPENSVATPNTIASVVGSGITISWRALGVSLLVLLGLGSGFVIVRTLRRMRQMQ